MESGWLVMKIDPLVEALPASVGLRAVVYEAGAAATWRTWLSPEERDCLATFGAETRKQDFLAGRAAARDLLADCLDVAPADVPLRRAADGAVDVTGADWRLSIAHSRGRALAAAARHPVGADLEEIRSRDPAIAEFLFPPEARGIVDTLPYAFDAALILCWTLKEAVLKARRSGFRRSPKELDLAVDPATETAVIQVRDGRAWHLFYTRLDDFWGAVALPKPD